MLATPTLASEPQYPPVVEPWLGPAVEAVQERLPADAGDAGKRDRIDAAIQQGAYHSTPAFLGEYEINGIIGRPVAVSW